jgi:hypothetical protein
MWILWLLAMYTVNDHRWFVKETEETVISIKFCEFSDHQRCILLIITDDSLKKRKNSKKLLVWQVQSDYRWNDKILQILWSLARMYTVKETEETAKLT